jgi:Holliday junction resolvase RusA-like endonuclease
MLAFTIYGDPRPQARPRMTKTGHVYTPKDSSDYRTRVRNAAADAMDDNMKMMFLGPVGVFLQIVKQSKTTGWKKAENKWLDDGGLMLHDKKPDADNVLKQICDACNGVVWRDDAQVVLAPPMKLHGREPLVRVWVWEMRKTQWTHESVEDLVELIERSSNADTP